MDEKFRNGAEYEMDDDPIILPIPFDDEAAAEARAEAERLEAMKKNAAEIVSMPDFSVDDEARRKAEEAEAARKAAQAALAAAQQAARNADAVAAEAQYALDKKRGQEAAAVAARSAEITFDAEGNSIVKITVPKDFDLEFSFRPKMPKK